MTKLKIILIGTLAIAFTLIAATQNVEQDNKRPIGNSFENLLKDRANAAELGTQVDEGSEESAVKYYQKLAREPTTLVGEVVVPQDGISFLTPDTILGSDISALLTYMGYPSVTAEQLHSLSSEKLMELEPGKILASRFFAPKVSDVQEHAPTIPEGGFGWRKLVWFEAKQGSEAAMIGISDMYLLQNTFTPTADSDPFDSTKFLSLNNQVILTRGSGPFSSTRKPAYFLLYGALVQPVVDTSVMPPKVTNLPDLSSGSLVSRGQLIKSLAATFDDDSGDRDPETNSPPRAYFAPNACIECHGGRSTRLKLNFLDTDHWFDRVTPKYGVKDLDSSAEAFYETDDFTALAGSLFGILYDGGKDSNSPEYKQAFSVLRKLNEKIKIQNVLTDETGTSFQVKSVKKWLSIHENDDSHVAPYERGFGDDTWEVAQVKHRKVLYFLNRYCYRCHSSVRFNIFDRDKLPTFGSMIDRLKNVHDSQRWMPQDRSLPGLTIKKDPAAPTGAPPEAVIEPGSQIDIFIQLLEDLKQ